MPTLRFRLLGQFLLLLPALVPLSCSSRRVELKAVSLPNSSVPRHSAHQAQFTEVTAAAGLRFQHVSGASGQKYYLEPFGSGCAFLDYDGDGWLDLLLVNSKHLPGDRTQGKTLPALFHNNRNGTFTEATRGSGLEVEMYGMGCSVGDYDNDGRNDIFVTAALAPSRLFRNEGSGKFKDITLAAFGHATATRPRWAGSCAWVDYDNDGYLDLFVCHYIKYSLDTDIRCTIGGLRTVCGPIPYHAESCALYHNERDGTFREVTRAAGVFKETGKSLGVALWDFDVDGFMDLVIANDLTPNYLFHNNRNGTFTEKGLELGMAYGEEGEPRAGMGIDVAEYHNDGKPSILISNFAGEPNSFFLQDASGHFSDITFQVGIGHATLAPMGWGLFFFDYDNDGWKDAFVANGHIEPDISRLVGSQTYGQCNLLFRNLRSGKFEEGGSRAGKPFSYQRVTRGAAYGDYDNDGDLDILLTNNNSEAELLRNDGGNKENWLQIELRGRKSNRNGVGAQVTVTAGKTTQRDYVRSGSSYLSQSMMRLHFGLGQARFADTVEVRWPSGAVDRCGRAAANQRVVVNEGRGATQAAP